MLLHNRKDISGEQFIEEYFRQVVETHVLVLSLIIFLFRKSLAIFHLKETTLSELLKFNMDG